MEAQKKAAILALALMAGAAMSFAQSSGEATYKAKCQMCHGVTGEGDTSTGKAMKVKPFNDPILIKMSDATILALTRNGSGKMPAYRDKLTDGQLKEVITYIHQLQKQK
jgi:mono/diheme cytochrome c family protein